MEYFISRKLYLPIIYIAIGFILYRIICLLINKFFSRQKKTLNKNDYAYKRIETIEVLFKNLVKYIIVIIVVLAILPNFGIDVTSLVAGLGIAGAVMGLAFQDILKDIFAGLGIIMENQFAIGDVVKVGTYKGKIVFLGLKTTRIRGEDGSVKIVANRNISELINYSLEENISEVLITSKTNDDGLDIMIKNFIAEKKFDYKNQLITLDYKGINEINDSGYIRLLKVKTKYFNKNQAKTLVYEELTKYINNKKIIIEVQEYES